MHPERKAPKDQSAHKAPKVLQDRPVQWGQQVHRDLRGLRVPLVLLDLQDLKGWPV